MIHQKGKIVDVLEEIEETRSVEVVVGHNRLDLKINKT